MISVLFEQVLRSQLLSSGETSDIDLNQLKISGSQYPAKVSKTFLDITADISFEQLVDFPTRKDKTLDLILTSHPSQQMYIGPPAAQRITV